MSLFNFGSFPVTPTWVEPVTPVAHASHTIQQSSGVVLSDGRVLHVWYEGKSTSPRSGYLCLGYSPDVATYLSTDNSVVLDRTLVTNTNNAGEGHGVWGNVSLGPDGALWLLHACFGGDNTGDWSADVTYDASMSAPPLPYTSRSMIWRSTDDGATWTYTTHMPQTVGLTASGWLDGSRTIMGGIDVIPAGFPNAGRWMCTAASANDYFGVMVWGAAVYVSDDSGVTWSRRLADTAGSRGIYHSAGSYGFGSDGNIYAGTHDNLGILGTATRWWRSADGGDTWSEYQTWYPTPNPADRNCGAGPWLTVTASNRLAGIVGTPSFTALPVRIRENDLTAHPTPLWDEAGTLAGADTYTALYDSGLVNGNLELLLRQLGAGDAALWSGPYVLGMPTLPAGFDCGTGAGAFREPVDPVTFTNIAARQESVVVDVLDAARNVIGRVEPSGGNLSVNGSGRYTRTLTGVVLDAADSAALSIASDRLRPGWVIDGVTYPLGVFLVGDNRRFPSTRPVTTETGWVDEQQIVAQQTETTIGFSAGTPVTTALESLLAPILVDVHIDVSSMTLAQSVAWPAGTDRSRIVASLCETAGFLPPYTDNNGTYRCVTAPDLASVAATHVYGSGSVVVDESRTESDSWLDTPNRYVVINTGATAGGVVGVFDVPASAPYSIASRGFAVTEVIEQQGIVDFLGARNAARAAYVASSTQFTTGFFDSPMLPTHDVWDVVQLGTALWLEVGWSVRLQAGAVQQHQLRRIYR